MKFSLSSQLVAEITTDLLVLPVFEGETPLNIPKDVIEHQKFTGKKGTSFLTHTEKARHVFVVGLGKKEQLKTEDVLVMAASVARKAIHLKETSMVIAVPKTIDSTQVVIGLVLGAYQFKKYQKKADDDQDTLIESVTLLPAEAAAIRQGELIAKAVTFTRDLINEPPSTTTPSHLAQVAQDIAKANKDISVNVLSKPEMEQLGMGGLLGIARGATEEPKFIHLSYTGGTKKTIALVGKGITFDSGGLSIKPANAMETMKLDMAGAAAVLGVFSALSALKLPITVHGLIPATENMLGPHAVKPGDIVRAMNGKTIEILNTDAEGRVVLADAMAYVGAKIKPDVIIDLATLTGACMVALGEDVAGLFVNNAELARKLQESAKRSGENIWELPLVEGYKKLLKSHLADIKNIAGTKYGGAITGALFIEAFVPENTAWAHLDIAGPSFAEKDAPLTPFGGTGFGVRLLLDYLANTQ